ncbi:MAG: CBS domain-containing protein [Spirochaetota bacterium]
MIVIIGHSNTDNDCLGSMVLMRYIYPDAVLLKSTLIHPIAKNLYSLYADFLNLKSLNDVSNQKLDKLIIVDTRTKARINEYLSLINVASEIEVWDHHIADSFDIENAKLISEETGANTSLIVSYLIKNNIKINPIDATIALTGIYADTGNFTHANTKDMDFEAANYLIKNGADIKIATRKIKLINHEGQVSLFHNILNNLIYKTIKGHYIILSYIELEDQFPGLSGIVEKVFEIENPDAYFAFFYFVKNKKGLIVARSRKEEINVNNILFRYHGGGHIFAGSAKIEDQDIKKIFLTFKKDLEEKMEFAKKAIDIMNKEVYTINEDWSVKQASIFLESVNCTGAPVVNKENKLVGFISLRDIMKARKINQINSPVSAYMHKKVITGTKDMTIDSIEILFQKYNIGHLPIIEDEKIVGIVTRKDIIKYLGLNLEEKQIIFQNIESL